MQLTATKKEASQWKKGFQAGLPIAIGYMPIAMAYGFIAKSTGLSFLETIFMSAFVYAGASQYMALDMIAKGIGMIEIVLTTFIVNIRHLLMSAALNEKTEKDSLWKKAVYAFGITDETFSVAAMQREKLSAGYMVGLNFIAYGSWVFFSGLGYVIGSALPDFFQQGMSVALYAMFIGLIVPSMKENRKVVFLAFMSAIFNSCFISAGLLSAGWSIVLSTLLSAFLVEMVLWMRFSGEEKQ